MPKPKIVSFARKLRLWPETFTDAETRLTKFRRLHPEVGSSVAEGASEPTADEDNLPDLETASGTPGPRSVSLSNRDVCRIARCARALVRAREAVSGTKAIRSEDVERLRGIVAGVELRGSRNEHEADELAARLLEQKPWHA